VAATTQAPPIGTRVRGFIVRRAELVAVATVLVGTVGWASASGTLRAGNLGVGLVAGAALALHATGLVLVYRVSGVINFAQLPAGAAAGGVFIALVHERLLLRGLRVVCPPCLPVPPESASPSSLSAADDATRAVMVAPSWMVQINYLLCAAIALAVGVAVVAAVYGLVIKRFTSAPRLVLTVATIGAGAVAVALAGVVLDLLPDRPGVSRGTAVPVPISGSFTLDPAVFTATDVVTVAATAAVSLWLSRFLRRSATGRLLRGAAENPQRAQTLGIDTERITALVWLLAGLLSSISAVLLAAKLGSSAIEGSDYLVKALAAATVGAFVSIPLAIVGAVAVGLVESSILTASGSGAPLAVLLVILISVLLVVQRSRQSRADRDAASEWMTHQESRPVPTVLSEQRIVRRTARLLVASGVVAVLAYPWLMPSAGTVLATTTMIFAVVSLSLLVLTGWAGQISLGQMALAGVGAWTVGVAGLPFLLSLPAAALAGAAAAVVLGLPALRLHGTNLAIVTLAAGFAVSAVLLSPEHLGNRVAATVGRPVLVGMDFRDERAFYYLILAMLGATVVLVRRMRRTRFARVLLAVKDNPGAAQAYGINLLKARLSAFAVSGALAAFGGALLAYAQQGVAAGSYTAGASITLFLTTVIGGFGSVAGPIAAAVYTVGLRELAGTSLGYLAQVLLSPGLGVVLLLLVLPGGLTEALFRVRDGYLRRVATRLRLEVPGYTDGAEEHEAPILPPQPDGRGANVIGLYRLSGQWATEPNAGRAAQ